MDDYKMGVRPTSPARPMTPDQPHSKHSFRAGMWQRLNHFLGRDDSSHRSPELFDHGLGWPDPSLSPKHGQHNTTTPCRPVGIGLPRQATFKRQNSERRERLCPVEPNVAERRAVSTSRHNSTAWCRRSRSTPPPSKPLQIASPTTEDAPSIDQLNPPRPPIEVEEKLPPNHALDEALVDFESSRPPRPASRTSTNDSTDERGFDVDHRAQLDSELDTRWILNLSMHFRDKSDREKFFVTYAQKPNKWRRVTVSCDYRNAEPNSLEMDLKELHFQRDKSLTIYEAIRDSLPEIQFYDTVTNLKLETSDGRLHVHVTEDVNEIIPYPSRATVAHIFADEQHRPLEVSESELSFDSHLSGFVYKVQHRGHMFIKKEIPGPDTVDEFLYEINALQALHDSEFVIRLKGIVLDDDKQVVKGLLIDYAERGAVVDLLYDHKGQIPWESRVRWARHAVAGLRDIHEEGYVQGDFTLSNIVVDENDNAKIIDINRRGCPVGWEPPEIATKIASNQRISMYIGEKSDLYQLGMTLWALAMDDDEPERHDPPLMTDEFPSEIPDWFQEIVRACLQEKPKNRLSAKELAKMFPAENDTSSWEHLQLRPILPARTEKQYIDPSAAVERDDLERFSREREKEEVLMYSPESSRNDYSFTWPKSSNYDVDRDSFASDFERGRTLPTNIEHLSAEERVQRYPLGAHAEQQSEKQAPHIVSISPDDEPEFDEIELDGKPYLVSRGTFSEEQLRILEDIPSRETLQNETQSSRQHRSPSPFAVAQQTSMESESTPRNSHTRLSDFNAVDKYANSSVPLGDRDSGTPMLDVEKEQPTEAADDSGEKSTEPRVSFAVGDSTDVGLDKGDLTSPKHVPEASIEAASQEKQEFDDGLPSLPRLAYADSGFHEPLDEKHLTSGDDDDEAIDEHGMCGSNLADSTGISSTTRATVAVLGHSNEIFLSLGQAQDLEMPQPHAFAGAAVDGEFSLGGGRGLVGITRAPYEFSHSRYPE